MCDITTHNRFIDDGIKLLFIITGVVHMRINMCNTNIWGVICVKIIKSNMPIFMHNRNANISLLSTIWMPACPYLSYMDIKIILNLELIDDIPNILLTSIEGQRC